MKKTRKFLGVAVVLAVLLVVLFALASCGNSEQPETKKCETHTWGEWTVKTAATCTAKGVDVRTCTVCGEEDTRESDMVAHTWGDWTTVKEATFTEKGSRKHTCSVCNAEETEDIAMLEHNFGDLMCDETLRVYHICKDCGIVEYTTFQDVTSKVAADVQLAMVWANTGATSGVWSDSAFTAKGTLDGAKITIVFGKDQITGKDISVGALFIKGSGDVDYTVKVVYADSDKEVEVGTGKFDGLKAFLVDDSKVISKVVIETVKGEDGGVGTLESVSLGRLRKKDFCDETKHVFNDGVVTKDPTCAAKGEKLRTCVYCGVTKTEEVEINPIAHVFGDWTVTKAATCDEEGSEERVCSLCNKKETLAIEKHAGSMIYGELKRTVECSTCGKVLVYTYNNITSASMSSIAFDGFWVNAGTVTDGNWNEGTCASKGGPSTITMKFKDGVKGDIFFVNGVNGPDYTVKVLYADEMDYIELGGATLTGTAGFKLNPNKEVKEIVIYVPKGVWGVDKWAELAIATVAGEATVCEHEAWNESVTKEATCTEKGEKLLTCKNCGVTKTEEIAVNSDNHDLVLKNVLTNLTCDADGKSEYECARCHKTATVTIPATGHTWGEYTYGKLTKERECVACGAKETTEYDSIMSTAFKDIALENFWANAGTLTDGDWESGTCASKGTTCKVTINFNENVKADAFFINVAGGPNCVVKAVYEGSEEAVEIGSAKLDGYLEFDLDNTKNITTIIIEVPQGVGGSDSWKEIAVATVKAGE